MIKITDKSKCSGCYSCYNKCPKSAIIMKEDSKGFKIPVVDEEKCIDCGICEKVCPIISKNVSVNEVQVFVCYNKNEEIRLKSSSGGIFSLIATEILNRKGVVFGAAFNEDFSLSHQKVESLEDLEKLRTSKYFQSSINTTYRETKKILEQDRYVLFTGTPCQIEGLISFLGKKYDKLYTQDIVCHGVPSPKVWKKYMEFRKNEDKDVPEKINFRDKSQEGWHLFSLSFKYKDSVYAKNQKEDLFMRVFLKDVCLRDSCYKCSFRKEKRVSDITLADCWGIKDIKPEMDDDKGISLILINSEKGRELFNIIKDNMIFFETTIEKAIQSNPAIVKSPVENKYREEFFKNLDSENLEKLIFRCTPKSNILKRLIEKCKRIIKKLIKR